MNHGAQFPSGHPANRPEGTAPRTGETGHRTAYLVAVGGALGWLLFLLVGASLPPASGQASLYGLAMLSWLVSLVGMYVDLDNLDRELADTSPALWVLGAVLLYILAFPWYVYERHTVAR